MTQLIPAHEAWITLLTTNKTAILAALAEAGLTRVVLAFDGQGDSGQIEEITAFVGEAPAILPEVKIAFSRLEGADATGYMLASEPADLSEVMEALTYDMLWHFEAGWPNNEGAYGELILDVPENEARLEFNARFTTSFYSGHTV